MNRLVAFFKKVRWGQTLTVFIAGIALLLMTACNSGDQYGARPNNPPVQVGGNNNPYKVGGDNYNDYRMSTDPKVHHTPGSGTSDSLKNRAGYRDLSNASDLTLPRSQMVASANIKSDGSTLLYPGSNVDSAKNPDIGPRGYALEPEPIPAKRQVVIDRSNPNERILEKIGQQFEDATDFLEDTADSASRAPEMRINPGLDK